MTEQTEFTLRFACEYNTTAFARYTANAAGYEIELLRAGNKYVVQMVPESTSSGAKTDKPVYVSKSFSAVSDKDAIDGVPQMILNWIDQNEILWQKLKSDFKSAMTEN